MYLPCILLGVIGTSAALLNPASVLDEHRRMCHELPAAVVRLFMGASCFYRGGDTATQNWWQAWDACAATSAGGRLAHIYDMHTMDMLADNDLFVHNIWQRIGLSAAPADQSLTAMQLFVTTPGVWRFDRDTLTSEDIRLNFTDRSGEVNALSAYTGNTGLLYTVAASTTFGSLPYGWTTASSRPFCEKAAPASSYELVAKGKRLSKAADLETSAHSVRACAHECHVRKWCFMFNYEGGARLCQLYPLLGSASAVHAMLVAAGSVDFYATRPAPRFKAECEQGPGAGALRTRLYQGRCYGTFYATGISSIEQLGRFCKARGSAHGIKGRLAYMRSRAMVRRLLSMLPLNNGWHCTAVNGRRDPATVYENSYGKWLRLDDDGQLTTCYPPPSAWIGSQPNNVNEPQLHVCKLYGGGLGDALDVGPAYPHFLCEFDDDGYDARWVEVAAGAGLSYEPLHILDTVLNVPMVKPCAFFCRKLVDCASVAYNPSTQECRLQRYEFAETGTAAIPTSADKQSAPGFVWYEDIAD